jgi:hypothetical protein
MERSAKRYLFMPDAPRRRRRSSSLPSRSLLVVAAVM